MGVWMSDNLVYSVGKAIDEAEKSGDLKKKSARGNTNTSTEYEQDLPSEDVMLEILSVSTAAAPQITEQNSPLSGQSSTAYRNATTAKLMDIFRTEIPDQLKRAFFEGGVTCDDVEGSKGFIKSKSDLRAVVQEG